MNEPVFEIGSKVRLANGIEVEIISFTGWNDGEYTIGVIRNGERTLLPQMDITMMVPQDELELSATEVA